MSKRNTQQRRHAIAAMVSAEGEVSVDVLASHFSTSEVTIRKDLAALESSGLLLRRYGGAISMPSEIVSTDSAEKVSERKQAIALAASGLIRDHNRIIVDCGSTTAALINLLGTKQGLVVMTNSLLVANAVKCIRERDLALLMTGGTCGSPFWIFSKVKSQSQYCTILRF